MKKEKIKTERYLVRFKNRFERLGSKLFLHDPDPEMRELYEKVRKRRLWHVDNIVKKKRKELKKEFKTKIRIERVFKETPLIVCKIQPELAEKLKKDPDVQSVLIDEKVEILAQEVPWGIERVKAISAHSITKGTGIKVAILDTGIDMNHEDLKDNYKGGYNVISPGSPPIDGHGHGCISPSDMVYTSLCGLQAIENLYEMAPGIEHYFQDGSIVKDTSRYSIFTIGFSNGETKKSRILAIHRLPYRGKTYRVKTYDSEIVLTPWHPVYVQTSSRGKERTIIKKRADELKKGDLFVASRKGQDLVDEYIVLPLRHRWICVYCGYIARYGKSCRCHLCHKSWWHIGPTVENVSLDEDLAYLVGLVISDGHLMKSSKSIEFINKNKKIICEFERLFQKTFNRYPKRYEEKRNPCIIRTRFHDVDARKFLNEEFGIPIGEKSSKIKVPNIITKSKRSVIMAFIAGLIEGDGNISKLNGKYRLSTGSKEFANMLAMLCKTLGIHSSVSVVKPSKSKHVSFSVAIGLSPDIADALRCKEPIRRGGGKPRNQSLIIKISEENCPGEMYDLTVEGSHNYVANGLIVSNTHVAGTIAARDNNLGVIGIAPEADLYSIKVLTDDGWGYWSWIVAGIEWCIENNMHVVNMSFGGYRDPGIGDIFKSAYQHGILLVAAAGNSGAGANTVGWPARYDSVIAVAAVDSADQRAWFSSTGPAVELAAPGVGVLSCVPGNNYEIHSGTSMACPHVVGSSALCWSLRTEMSNVDVRKWLQENALDLGSLGRDDSFGYGLVQVENLTFKQDIEFVAEAKAGKPFDWSFETEFHPLWFLKTQQKYGKTQDFQFETEYSPDWYLKTQQKYGKFQEFQFQTELNPIWNLIVSTAAYKPYEFSFKTIFPPREEKFGPALIELYRPQKYEKKILTIPINWLFKGTQRELGFEVWYAKNQEKKVLDDLRLNIRTLTNTNEGGKEIVDNSWFKVKKAGNGGYSNPIDFSLGGIEPNSCYGVSFLLDVPANAQSLGFVTFALDFLGIDNIVYDEFSFGAALYSGVVLAKETVVVRAHVLNPM